MAQTRQNMGSGNVKKLLLQLMIPAVVAHPRRQNWHFDRDSYSRRPDGGQCECGKDGRLIWH